MSEEIINDGVNLESCIYITYKDSKSPICSETGLYCKEDDTCYYKQLKRLQKENEELKAENKNYAKLMLEQQEISQKYWECIGKIKQAIEVLAETCNVYPLKTNLDKLITTINEVLNDRD